MKKIVLHIPHSSAVIPDFKGYVSTEDEIQQAVSALSAVFAELQAEHEQKAAS